ncbi:MAG: CopG family transcriptional regulator [Blautia sp.]|nr:CopG family transcriptional regulator [Blautia sp.]
MNEKKLIIQSHKYSGATTVTSVRMPKDMLAAIDQAASETGRSRNEIIMLCIEFSLEHMQIEK